MTTASSEQPIKPPPDAGGQEKSPPPVIPEPTPAAGAVKMPPPGTLPPAAAPRGGGRTIKKPPDKMLDRLRELSAEMIDLQDVLAKVQLGETSLALFADYINKTVLDVDELVSGLTDGDTARHILNAWEQMQVNPLLRAPDGDHEAQAQLHYLNLLNEQIDKIVFWCGTLTIPERLAAWLDTQRPGYYVPFNQVFEDELPNPEDRLRLLESLALAPKLLRNGFVDLEAGLVYRYSEKKLERLRSFAYLILAALLFTGIVVGACLPAWPGWPLERENLAALLVGWVALLVGVIVHNGVGSVKRSRARGGLPVVVAPSEWQIIINAKAGQMILKLFIALIGLFALVFSSGIDQVTLFNSFLVGYSLDSFVEMFGASMEQRAGAQLSAMQQKLGGG